MDHGDTLTVLKRDRRARDAWPDNPPRSRSPMRSFDPLALLAAASASVLVAAPAWGEDAASILDANRLASGGSPTAPPGTLNLEFSVSGQGLSGTVVTRVDRRTG